MARVPPHRTINNNQIARSYVDTFDLPEVGKAIKSELRKREKHCYPATEKAIGYVRLAESRTMKATGSN